MQQNRVAIGLAEPEDLVGDDPLRAQPADELVRVRRGLRRWLGGDFSRKPSLRRAAAHPDQVQGDAAEPGLERAAVGRHVLGRDQPGLLHEMLASLSSRTRDLARRFSHDISDISFSSSSARRASSIRSP